MHWWMTIFTKSLIFGIEYFCHSIAVRSCGPAWWNLVCSAETTNFVKWWFGRNHLINGLLKKYTVVIVLPLWETFLIDEWMQCFERIGICNPLLFHQFFEFLCIRNLISHLHTASENLVKILCTEGGYLPLGHGISADVWSSAVCIHSDEYCCWPLL